MTYKFWGTEDAVRAGGSLDRDALAMLPNGGYVVTWRENSKIAFQVYDGNGVKSDTVHFVEASTLPQQFSDVYAYDTEGSFVITWTESNPVSGRTLRNQKFNFDGSENGGASALNSITDTDGAQTSADTVPNSWATAYIDKNGSTRAVKVTQNGALIQVATGSGVDLPDMAFLGGNKHLVTYRSDSTNVAFKIVADGALGAGKTVSGTRADAVALKDPATGLPNGKFAFIVEKGAAGIEAHFYEADGSPSKDTFGNDIVTGVGGAKPNSDFDCVSATALKSGGIAVAYIAADGPDFGDVYVRVVGADGVAGQPLKVNARASLDGPGSQKDPTISEMADGRLAVSWHDPSQGNGLISTTVLDLRTAKVTVAGTSHNDIYAPSEFSGDNLDGKDGIDTLTFKGASAGVAVNLAEGKGTAGDAAGDTYTNFENIIGSNFADNLVGGAGANVLNGGAGNDYLDGGADADVMIGGTGGDTFIVNDAGDVLQESADGSIDTAYSSVTHTLEAYIENMIATGSDAISLTGNGWNNSLVGNGANNTLLGYGGNDVLNGNGGADYMDGGTGNDTYYIDNLGDVVHDSGSGDVDTVIVNINYDLNTLVGIENITGSGTASITLKGNAYANLLAGNDGANIIYGNAGSDSLFGYGGNDRIHGGLGADKLTGGTGRDTFVFDTNPKTKGNADKILDFVVKDDSIYLENKYFKVGSKGSLTKPAALASKMFYTGTKAHDADDRIIYDKNKGVLYYDDDGIGAHKAVAFATLKKGLKMTYHDFFVI